MIGDLAAGEGLDAAVNGVGAIVHLSGGGHSAPHDPVLEVVFLP